MLNQIDLRANKLQTTSEEELEQLAADFFKPQSAEIRRRLKEQVILGNITVQNDRDIELSGAGKRLVRINQFVTRLFGLNPTYSGKE